MSFALEVKEELIKHYTKNKTSQKAELAALILFDEKNVTKDFDRGVFIYNFTSLKKTFNINLEYGELEDLSHITKDFESKRAFIRGAFIARGSINNPEKSYHFEISCDEKNKADFLKELFETFDINPKISMRRDRCVVYLKDGVDIADALNVCEANKALMNFENMRIVREVRGSVNRKVNCETANIEKTITASMKQIDDINYIKETVGLDYLDDNLQSIAKVRLDNKEVPLSQLGELLNPPLGKSGVNHRLRKISEIANKLRRSQ